MADRNVPPIGITCNATGIYNQANQTIQAVQVGINSNVVDTKNSPFVSAFGNLQEAASCTVNLQYSADGVNFNTAHSVTVATSADWAIDCNCGGQFVRLNYSNPNAVGYATIQAKG